MAEGILVADGERGTREALVGALRARGYDVETTGDGLAALEAMETRGFDVVVADLQLAGADGIAVLKRIRDTCPRTLVLVTTANPSLPSAIEALRNGATDYIVKPIALDDFVAEIGRLLEVRSSLWQRPLVRRESGRPEDFAELIGRSPAMRHVVDLIGKIAPTRSPVLITGESGTGKEVVARAIHHASGGALRGFFPFDCTGIAEPVLESQLFGRVHGAAKRRDGLFALARRGTIFLDDVGDMPLGLQAKVLRAIETREVLPVGATTPTAVDARVIAASNRDLRRAIEAGTFNEKLYYCLNVVSIQLPPLREHRDDIPALVEYLIRHYNAEMKRAYRGVDEATTEFLMAQPWKGNVRELANAVEHAMIVGDGERIAVKDLPRAVRQVEDPLHPVGDDLRGALHAYERMHIETVLRRTGHDKRAAAERLGLSLSSLYRKLSELGIDQR